MKTTEIRKKGFKRGYNQLCLADVKTARMEIWEALGVTYRSRFQAYRLRIIYTKGAQVAAVEEVFCKYG